jgi:hypothetical protein
LFQEKPELFDEVIYWCDYCLYSLFKTNQYSTMKDSVIR